MTGKPKTGTRADRRKRVPQVMQAQIRQLRQLADLAPWLLQVDQVLAPALAWHHERIALQTGQGSQKPSGGGVRGRSSSRPSCCPTG